MSETYFKLNAAYIINSTKSLDIDSRSVMTEWTLQLEKEPNDKMQTKPTVNLKLKGYSTNSDKNA